MHGFFDCKHLAPIRSPYSLERIFFDMAKLLIHAVWQ